MFPVLIIIVMIQIITECQSLDFVQKDYELIHDHMLVDYFNKEYFHDLRIWNTKYNRTARTFSANFELLKDMNSLVVTVKPYVFVSNQYVKFAPLGFTFDYCKTVSKNLFGIRDTMNNAKAENLTHCPIKKGIHQIKDWLPATNKLPPKLPNGKYKVNFLGVGENKFYELSWYGNIRTKEALKEKQRP